MHYDATADDVVLNDDEDIDLLYHILWHGIRKNEPERELKSLVHQNPRVLLWQDKEGRTLLFRAVFTSSPITFDAIRFLVTKCPEAVGIGNHHKETPLHVACSKSLPIKIFHLMMDFYPTAAQRINAREQTPLHLACGNERNRVQVVRRLLKIYPEAAKKRDMDGNTPPY